MKAIFLVILLWLPFSSCFILDVVMPPMEKIDNPGPSDGRDYLILQVKAPMNAGNKEGFVLEHYKATGGRIIADYFWTDSLPAGYSYGNPFCCLVTYLPSKPELPGSVQPVKVDILPFRNPYQ